MLIAKNQKNTLVHIFTQFCFLTQKATISTVDLLDKGFSDQDTRVFDLVATYLKIVMNTSRDLTPKMIVSIIINGIKKFIVEEFYVK